MKLCRCNCVPYADPRKEGPCVKSGRPAGRCFITGIQKPYCGCTACGLRMVAEHRDQPS